MKELDLPKSLKEIAAGSFSNNGTYGVKALEKVNYGGELKDWFMIDFEENPLRNADLYCKNKKITANDFIVDTGLGSNRTYQTPEGVTVLKKNCFTNNGSWFASGEIKLIISGEVVKIYAGAFNNVRSFNEVDMFGQWRSYKSEADTEGTELDLSNEKSVAAWINSIGLDGGYCWKKV